MRDIVLQYNIDNNILKIPNIWPSHTCTSLCTLTHAYEHNYMNMDTKSPHTPTHTHQHTYTPHTEYAMYQINE